MNYCQYCGGQLEGSKKFCPTCGSAVVVSPATEQSMNYSQSNPQNQYYNQQANYYQQANPHPQANQYQNPNQGYYQKPNTNQENMFSQVQNDNTMLMSILAYLFLLVPLVTGAYKTSEVVKFHTNQGTVLLIACVIWSVVRMFIATALAFVPYYGWVLSSLLHLVWIGFAALYIVGIMNVVNNKMKPLPIIGNFKIIK